jgi:hypothetical protein
MVEQVITYFDNMLRLKNEGVPIDWQVVATAMATTLRQIPPELPKED